MSAPKGAGGGGGGLAEVLGLVLREFDMPIRWSENGNIVPEVYIPDCEIAAVYSERDDDQCPRKAEAIIAAVNYLHSHGEAIAELVEVASAIAQRDTHRGSMLLDAEEVLAIRTAILPFQSEASR